MPAGDFVPQLDSLPGSGRVTVAFSGGADSVCLLHQARSLLRSRGLLAVHVDHGLDRGSAGRADRAVGLAASLGVDCRIERVQVRRSGSLEANARDARYAALALHVPDNGVLLTAHHADDVAETMILRLLRGAGPGGLSGIPGRRRFGAAWLVRPLLDWNRARILDYLERWQLDSISDPANDLLAMDRNFIRHEILPLLKVRFPGAVVGMSRAAALNRAAVASLNALAAEDLGTARRDKHRLHWPVLAALDEFRCSEAIRLWCINSGYPPPPGARLDEFLRQIRSGAPDRQPELRWAGASLRSWRSALWLEPQRTMPFQAWCLNWDARTPLDLPPPSGRLVWTGSADVAPEGLQVCSGRPGEKLRLSDRKGHQRINKLMLEHGIPPWQRLHWPRLYSGERLLAVGSRWLDSDFGRQLDLGGASLEWHSELFEP